MQTKICAFILIASIHFLVMLVMIITAITMQCLNLNLEGVRYAGNFNI